jgi:hypothetical protein
MGKHTPEPWETSRHTPLETCHKTNEWTIVKHNFPNPPYEGELCNEYGIYPPLGESGPVALVAGEVNAARIVACVNALRGLDVERVELLMDAIRRMGAAPAPTPTNWCEPGYADAVEHMSAIADSIRAGGGQ